MEARMRVLTALFLAFCAGIANATTSADKPISHPSRSLLGSQLGYIPQGCPLTVSVSADESDSSWFQDAPEIRGSVTLSNPTSYNVPINNIIVQARSSNGLQYSTQVYCGGNGSPTVPFNPVPYTYGTLTCRYRLVLDRNVFGSYGQSGNRKLLGSGSVQANFFPGSSGSSSGSGGYGYFPPTNQRPTWTVAAIVTVSYSNAQCLSAPTPVNTDCWWSWLSSWYQQHNHGWSWLVGSGRKLLMRLAGAGAGSNAAMVVGGESVQAGSDSSVSRSLLGSHSEQSSSDSRSEHRHHHNHRHHMHSGSSESGGYSGSSDSARSLMNTDDSGSEHRHRHHNHRHHMHTGSSESGRFSSGYSNSGRSLLNTDDSGSEHRHRHHNHHHHMHTGSSESGRFSSGSESGRSLLNTDDSGSEHREQRHHNHRHHMHMHSEHNSGSYSSGSDSGRSLLSTDDSGSEHREHRHRNHRHHMHMHSEHSGGSYSGRDSGRSLLHSEGSKDSGSEPTEHRHHHNHHLHNHRHSSSDSSGSYTISGDSSSRSLLHSEGFSNSGSERSEHRHHQHHNHNHHMSSEHHTGSYSGGFSSGGYDSNGRSLLNADGAASVQVVVPGSPVVDVNASAQDTDVQVGNIITDADK